MQMIHLTRNFGFVVEGFLEKEFFARNCRGVPVKRIGANGDCVSIKRLCDFIGTQVRLLVESCDVVVVVFDREGRSEPYSSIEAQVLSFLTDQGIDTSKILVGVADRNIENWLYADYINLSKYYGTDIDGYCGDGAKGKVKLKKAIGSKSYSEKVDGVSLLKSACTDTIKANSPSAMSFFSRLEQRIDCWWIAR